MLRNYVIHHGAGVDGFPDRLHEPGIAVWSARPKRVQRWALAWGTLMQYSCGRRFQCSGKKCVVKPLASHLVTQPTPLSTPSMIA